MIESEIGRIQEKVTHRDDWEKLLKKIQDERLGSGVLILLNSLLPST
jgi:hypothetical protein